MRIVSGFIVREIAGNTVAVPTGDSARRLSGLVALNGSGKFLFELLQTEQSQESLVQALTDAYEVTREVASADVAEFIVMLRENNMLADAPV